MKHKRNNIDLSDLYSYTVFNISEGRDVGFKAVIPKFPKILVLADSPMELHRAVKVAIKEEIAYLRKNKKPVPKSDLCKYSGKFVLRVKPEIHEKLAELSKASGRTLNQYLNNLIESSLN